MKEGQNYLVILQEPHSKIHWDKSLFNLIQWTVFNMEKNVMVDPGKIGCITPSNTYLKKNFNAKITKKLYRMIRTYWMQPWPGNFNQAGTFGYANALLLFDVSSKQGRAKKTDVIYMYMCIVYIYICVYAHRYMYIYIYVYMYVYIRTSIMHTHININIDPC